MSLQNFIANRPYFVWWTGDPTHLSDEAIIEATLTSGNWDDVQEMLRLVGMESAARVFRKQVSSPRSNYSSKTRHFFTLYFDAHAPRNP